MLWVVLTPIVLGLAAVGVWFLKAVVQGAIEGWRSASDEDADGSGTPEEVLAEGFLPADRQNTEFSCPEPEALTRAVGAARAGDWQPTAALLAGTGRDWEHRARYSERLAGVAATDDTWLLAWEAARPDDPDAALVRARSTVRLAWKVRGGQRAKHTTQEQFDGFHRTLARSREENARAAALNPDDPSPYINEIWTALGLGYPQADMDRIWDEITARAPHHYEAHFSALQFWCAKWRGSKELATEFAKRAADAAPPGSLIKVFPLIAHYEHDESDDADVERSPEMRALVDAALADAHAADPGHPRLAEVRHLLAYYLSLQDRDEAAMEQFRLVDGYVNALPWRYWDDGAERYCALRDETVARVLENR
ncbi:hypothetical protein [Streptomyces clavuligerus]|uniref:Putative membrane protein n=1 Tax=Streptomyces clavuligerus TaxID=1901 RepID=E2Q0H6_STRCL|nr:hypothetical protein [Streptomyces clavuligerus]ANW16955.1 hypothetical protein BB341_01275 [Streptomyces clavuligerus]AXU11484.1 hypothetical protein D1794_01350 [Streptomyces clavuligerus]EFG10519.1 Putative membrane protein [Streptomyces clavuligerus]MBY6301303.1 hypothetical protein [Streptomyces clavuligerus]QCS04356.1 hypothetical protein CRV15_01350 [Streptomyces clavuligerus]